MFEKQRLANDCDVTFLISGRKWIQTDTSCLCVPKDLQKSSAELAESHLTKCGGAPCTSEAVIQDVSLKYIRATLNGKKLKSELEDGLQGGYQS